MDYTTCVAVASDVNSHTYRGQYIKGAANISKQWKQQKECLLAFIKVWSTLRSVASRRCHRQFTKLIEYSAVQGKGVYITVGNEHDNSSAVHHCLQLLLQCSCRYYSGFTPVILRQAFIHNRSHLRSKCFCACCLKRVWSCQTKTSWDILNVTVVEVCAQISLILKPLS